MKQFQSGPAGCAGQSSLIGYLPRRLFSWKIFYPYTRGNSLRKNLITRDKTCNNTGRLQNSKSAGGSMFTQRRTLLFLTVTVILSLLLAACQAATTGEPVTSTTTGSG